MAKCSGITRSTPRANAVELALACALWLYLFLLIASLAVARSVGAALFLSRFDSAGLALTYMMVGISIPAVVLAFERIGSKLSMQAVASLTLALAAAGAAAFALAAPKLSPEAGDPAFGAAYLSIEIFAFLATVQFWAISNSAFTVQQARRYYAFLGAGGICGSIAGGIWARSLSSGSAAEAIWAIVTVMPFLLGLVIAAGSLSRAHRRQNAKRPSQWNWNLAQSSTPDSHNTIDDRPTSPPAALRSGLGLVVALTVFGTTLIDFYYKTFAASNFGGNVQRMTAFFGGFYICVGICTLFAQLALTSSILRNRSAFFGLLLSPASLLAFALLNALVPGLWSVAALKLTDSVLAHSVNRSCQELLYTPLPLRWVRTLKSAAEGVWGRSGLFLAGAFLFALSLVVTFDISRWLLATIVVALFMWALAVERLRRTYSELAARSLPTENADRPVYWDELMDRPEREAA